MSFKSIKSFLEKIAIPIEIIAIIKFIYEVVESIKSKEPVTLIYTIKTFALPVGILIIVTSFIIYLWISRKKPPQVALGEHKEIEFRYANDEDIKKIYELDSRVFKKRDIIKEEIFLNWHRKNNNIFTVAYFGEQFVGYYSILPLKKSIFNKFLCGEIKEKDITPDNIVEAKRVVRLTRLYLFSIAVEPEVPYILKNEVSYKLFCNIAHCLDKQRKKGNLKKIYATGATKRGENLLKGFKFTKISESKKREDKHNLYEKEISEVNIKDLIKTHWQRIAVEYGEKT
ncbi:MAG: hypothetical protein JXA92_00405 [candidate division Zixibacteria bacterium]|nr:hypothetical protein [candidate division Zixibacteria bacterium]